MAKQPEPDGFERVLADHRTSSHYFEEMDGSHRLWSELSAEGKLAYLAGDAVRCGVSFARFQAAVREVLGAVEPAVREEAALRLALRSEQELHAVARLLPPDERLEGTPLPERVAEALEASEPAASLAAEALLMQRLAESLRECKDKMERVQGEWQGIGEQPWPEIEQAGQVLAEAASPPGAERRGRLADYVIYDTSEAVLDSLEAFGDEFERLARTPEQRQLVAAFQQFVGEFTGAVPHGSYRQMLAERAAAGSEKSPDKDKGIER